MNLRLRCLQSGSVTSWRGIIGCLSQAHLETVIAHEEDVRRRDNLVNAIHISRDRFLVSPIGLVDSLRLPDEQERACDEEVLRLGNDPQIYAESIVMICQFYLKSPLIQQRDGSGLEDDLAAYFTRMFRRPVIDRTGWIGRYDFSATFFPEETALHIPAASIAAFPPGSRVVMGLDDSSLPALASALDHQLGLKLEAGKFTDRFLVIDPVDKPTSNEAAEDKAVPQAIEDLLRVVSSVIHLRRAHRMGVHRRLLPISASMT